MLSSAVWLCCPGIKSRNLWGQCRVLVLNSLLLGLSVFAEMDHPGGFSLAAISYLLNSPSARTSQQLWEGSW